MIQEVKLSVYVRASILLVGFYVLVSMLWLAQDMLLPVIYALILGLLLSPVVSFLVRRGVRRFLAILIVLLLTLLLVSGLVMLLVSQASVLRDNIPELKQKFSLMVAGFTDWLSTYFQISHESLSGWYDKGKAELTENQGTLMGSTISSVGGVLGATFLTPVYLFMVLFYQRHLVTFIHRLFGASRIEEVTTFLQNTRTIVQGYLVGLFLEFLILAALNILGLWILGIKFFFLLGILGAFLNIIPYLGGIIGVILFMIIALLTKTPDYVLYVALLYSIIQFIDNNLIVPRVVGAKVKLNALVSLFAVIAGAALWGIPGMLLSIPLTAILKLLFDQMKGMKAWGFLLGESEETTPALKR